MKSGFLEVLLRKDSITLGNYNLHEVDSDYIWNIYKRLTKNQTLIFEIHGIGTKLTGLLSSSIIIIRNQFVLISSLKTLLKSMMH